MVDIIVIGIGNPFRGDDGVGWSVIDALQSKIGEFVVLQKSRGEISEILEAFQNYRAVYLIDACLGDTPGRWMRLDALQENLLEEKTQTSTHGLSIAQAIALARTFNQLPKQLVLYAIFGDRYQLSCDLSPPVAQSISLIVERLMQEKDIQACMKKA